MQRRHEGTQHQERRRPWKRRSQERNQISQQATRLRCDRWLLPGRERGRRGRTAKRPDHDVRRFAEDQVRHVVEGFVGGGDVLDTDAFGSSKVEGVVGQQSVLRLQFQGDVKVVGADGLDDELARQQVAYVIGIDMQLAGEFGPTGQHAGRVCAGQTPGAGFLDHASMRHFRDRNGGEDSFDGAGGATREEAAAGRRPVVQRVKNDVGVHADTAAIKNVLKIHWSK
jgi:hypothetical protein